MIKSTLRKLSIGIILFSLISFVMNAREKSQKNMTTDFCDNSSNV